MHCLEDAVEYLEYLPEEIRKKCIELQQLDSRNTVELSKLVAETRSFFSNFGSSFNAIDSEKKNKEFLDRFQELRDNGEEKVQITEYLHLVLEKYQERIAKDIAEFKAELEIDNPGETDIIEKSFMQAVSEQPILVDDISKVGDETEQQFEASRPSTSTTICGLDANRVNGHRTIVAADGEVTPKRLKQFEEFKIPANFRRITPQIGDQTSSPSWTMFDEDIFDAELTPPVKRPRLAPPGRQPSFTVPQDPREPAQLPHREIQYPSFPHSNSSTSLKTEYMLSSSYPARLSEGDFAVPSSSRQQPAAIRMPLLAGAPTRHGRPRKLTKKVEQMLIGTRAPGLHSQQLGEQGRPSFRANTIHRGGHRQTSMKRMPQQRRTTADGQGEEEEELDEERYSFDDEEEDEDEGEEEEDGDDEEEADDNRAWCICKQGSHGNMVACDNKNCPYEWFHYECVGIQQPPKGRWYCPTCQMQISMRRSRSASSDLARRD